MHWETNIDHTGMCRYNRIYLGTQKYASKITADIIADIFITQRRSIQNNRLATLTSVTPTILLVIMCVFKKLLSRGSNEHKYLNIQFDETSLDRHSITYLQQESRLGVMSKSLKSTSTPIYCNFHVNLLTKDRMVT
jgi:hypothetical protein